MTRLRDHRPRTTDSLRIDGMRDYTKVEAWKRLHDLTVAIYDQTRVFQIWSVLRTQWSVVP